jgi:hypothetical protein
MKEYDQPILSPANLPECANRIVQTTRLTVVVASILFLTACANMPSILSADTASQAGTKPVNVSPYATVEHGEMLAAMDTLLAGESFPLGQNGSAVAGAAYSAASGRLCREVAIRQAGRLEQRLACQDSGNWAWYPFVLP